MKLSIICVFNNQHQYDEQLKLSLGTQNIDFEMIGIDNTQKRFSSAASALNYGASIAKGDVLVFSHQDIYLKTEKELMEFSEAISKAETGTIIGTQGVREPSRKYYTNLTSGAQYNSELSNQYERRLYEVSCVDEGFFGMKKSTWEKHHFDELLCDNWHLYCVEACLFSRKNGHKVYVYPVQLHHFSRGIISHSYMDNLKEMCKVYRKDFKYIWTTCYKVRTNPIYINSLVFAWKLNRRLKCLIKQVKQNISNKGM